MAHVGDSAACTAKLLIPFSAAKQHPQQPKGVAAIGVTLILGSRQNLLFSLVPPVVWGWVLVEAVLGDTLQSTIATRRVGRRMSEGGKEPKM
mmetsp:Transcript_6522/g.12914  ORF Transcript_6522/g.12914 Transcript_6522/m.12914 type:complete len:92 (-) Transcript_6522:3-278(-)